MNGSDSNDNPVTAAWKDVNTEKEAITVFEGQCNDLPLLEPGSSFVDNVMQSIDQDVPRTIPTARIPGNVGNGLVAAAATYIFVSSGVFRTIININAVEVHGQIKVCRRGIGKASTVVG